MTDDIAQPYTDRKHLLREHLDAVVIGAGALGCFWAQRLATRGKSVAVLESGPPWSLRDLYSSQIWSRRLKWGGSAVLAAGKDKFGHNMSNGWGFGGSALHHYGGWPRLHAEDFRTHALYGRGQDWPFDYAELQPWYDRMQSEVILSGDAAAEVWRPPGAPYPQPPLRTFRQGAVIAEGFRRLGLRVAPAPLAILSQGVGGRAACLYDGWCDAGCPIGALANPLVIHLPQARAAGAHFEAHASVIRIVIDRRGRAAGVLWRDALGREHLQRADLIVLAAGTIQTVRLLLASVDRQRPRGIANSTGLVGAGFCCHAVASAYGIFDEPLDNFLGVTAGQLISQDRYGKRARGAGGAFGSHQWGIAPALKLSDLLGIANTRSELYGSALREFVERDGPRLGTLSAVCETLPSADRRIELTAERDAHGMPLARTVNTFDADAVALYDSVNRDGREILTAAGAKTVWNGARATAHALGGTLMGTHPANSVCNPFGSTHEVPNLIISGGSLFPMAGGGSPTFTLYALADRSSEHVLHEWSHYVTASGHVSRTQV